MESTRQAPPLSPPQLAVTPRRPSRAAAVTTVYSPMPAARPPPPNYSATVFRRALVGNAVIVAGVLALAPVFILHEVRAMAPEAPPTPPPKQRDLEAAFLRTGDAVHLKPAASCAYETLDLNDSPLGERVVCSPGHDASAAEAEAASGNPQVHRPMYDPTPSPPTSLVAAHVRDVLEGRLPPVVDISCYSLELPVGVG